MTIEEYASGLFAEWGIGKKQKDNGVLLLVSMGDRSVRIEVGYGLEPSLPDGRAGEPSGTVCDASSQINAPRGLRLLLFRSWGCSWRLPGSSPAQRSAHEPSVHLRSGRCLVVFRSRSQRLSFRCGGSRRSWASALCSWRSATGWGALRTGSESFERERRVPPSLMDRCRGSWARPPARGRVPRLTAADPRAASTRHRAAVAAISAAGRPAVAARAATGSDPAGPAR